ncbi:MAG: DUF481 domain-containing protein [Candidatus Electrothrix aestuarii]|uniref:DUF481 domain-containing protein n=1 Tax=Candidatus Electrothrix aestuarii TaxID=3062594 RepID=A0AAU8LY58_9BACT
MNHRRTAVMLSAAMLLTGPAYAENTALEGEQQEEEIISENLSRSEHSGDVVGSSNAWSASLSFGFDMNSGNTNSINTNAQLQGTKKIGRDSIKLILEGSYGETEVSETSDDGTMNTIDAVTDQQALAFAMYEKRMGRYIVYPFIQLSHNEITQIEMRLMTGVGGGYYFIENDQTELSAVAGTAFVRKDMTTDETDDYGVFFFALTHKLSLSENSRISEHFEILPRIDDMGDYRLKATASIETDIWENISLKFSVKDEYDVEPAEGVDKNDLSLSTSLVFTL